MASASRSLKPASYLASSAKQSNRSPRPSFTRTSSNSSCASTKSDDSFVATLRSLSVESKSKLDRPMGTGFERPRTPVNAAAAAAAAAAGFPQENVATPGRKKSDPIAIDVQAARRGNAAVYTPLTARGDLPGGYFPNHEDHKAGRIQGLSGHSHKISDVRSTGTASPSMSISSASSAFGSPSNEATPKMPTHMMMPPSLAGPLSPPEALLVPMGKYHPSNYVSPASTQVSSPTSMSTPRSGGGGPPLPPTHLEIPNLIGSKRRAKHERPSHMRKASDVQRALAQYRQVQADQAQRIATKLAQGQMSEAQLATYHTTPSLPRKEPTSPRLQPAGSPGPITPFELEDEEGGYLAAGRRARGGSLIGNGVAKEREIDKGDRRRSGL